MMYKRTCIFCGKDFETSSKIRKTCSTSCSKKQGIKTRLDRENVLWTQEMKDKARKTNFERYGCYGGNVEKQKQTKAKKTDIEKYISAEKSKKTRLERYNDPNYNNHSKAVKTNLERYGVENPMQVLEVQEKSKTTCQKHYGCDYYVKTKESKEHIKQVLKRKYGVLSVSQLKKNRKSVEILNDKDKFIDFLKSIPFDCRYKSEICEYLDIGIAQFNWRLRKWGLNKLISYRRNRSSYEVELSDVFDSWGLQDDYLVNDRTVIRNPDTDIPLELDFYFPKHKLAVEFNGIIWHNKENPIRETKKTTLCEHQGILLVHIWEDEYLADKTSIIDNLKDLLFNTVAISSVEVHRYDSEQDVYDIEVPEYSNFVINDGLVVHNSADSKQQFITAGFEDTSIVSLDKKPEGYLCFKSAVNERRIQILDGQEDLITQLINLEQNNQTGKVDHPINGKKDTADGLAGAVYNASLHDGQFAFHLVDDAMLFGDVNQVVEDSSVDFVNGLIANPKDSLANRIPKGKELKPPTDMDNKYLSDGFIIF